MVETPRRRLLAAAATGSALTIAGCSALEEGGPDEGDGDASGTDDADADESDTDDSSADGAGGGAAATVAVDIDERMQERQAELQEQLEEGEIDQEEAQAELQAAQMEVLSETIDDLEAEAADVDGLTVADTNAEFGLALVEGDASAVLETLDLGYVAGLLAADEFQAA